MPSYVQAVGTYGMVQVYITKTIKKKIIPNNDINYTILLFKMEEEKKYHTK